MKFHTFSLSLNESRFISLGVSCSASFIHQKCKKFHTNRFCFIGNDWTMKFHTFSLSLNENSRFITLDVRCSVSFIHQKCKKFHTNSRQIIPIINFTPTFSLALHYICMKFHTLTHSFLGFSPECVKFLTN